MHLLFLLLFLLLPGLATAAVTTERITNALSNPTYLTAAPGDTTRLFVTQRFGNIVILDQATGASLGTFLNIQVSIEGLQGLAFHPDYDTNGFFYVQYYFDDASNIVRYSRDAVDPDLADPSSAVTVLVIPQPFGNHNANWIGFGPDGYLYVTVGDGGSGERSGRQRSEHRGRAARQHAAHRRRRRRLPDGPRPQLRHPHGQPLRGRGGRGRDLGGRA